MIKLYKTFKLFKEYKKLLNLNKTYLKTKYDIEINNWYEFYTTITLLEAPEDLIKKFGATTVAEQEIQIFIKKITQDLDKLDLEELVNVYEIKKLNNLEYGITFGFRPLIKWLNNRRIIMSKVLLILTFIISLFLILI